MEVQVTANGAVTLVIVPTNEMEVEMLKQLANQNNEINFTANGITIVNKSVPQGLVISKIPPNATTALEHEESNNNNQESEIELSLDDTDESDSEGL